MDQQTKQVLTLHGDGNAQNTNAIGTFLGGRKYRYKSKTIKFRKTRKLRKSRKPRKPIKSRRKIYKV